MTSEPSSLASAAQTKLRATQRVTQVSLFLVAFICIGHLKASRSYPISRNAEVRSAVLRSNSRGQDT